MIRIREYDPRLTRAWEEYSASSTGEEDAIDEFIDALQELFGQG